MKTTELTKKPGMAVQTELKAGWDMPGQGRGVAGEVDFAKRYKAMLKAKGEAIPQFQAYNDASH
ncbi:MAG: hypothetical protein WCK35_00925 [Chloroflexota bacterium]